MQRSDASLLLDSEHQAAQAARRAARRHEARVPPQRANTRGLAAREIAVPRTRRYITIRDVSHDFRVTQRREIARPRRPFSERLGRVESRADAEDSTLPDVARHLLNPTASQSGRPDLNRGPHRPERCALPGCATPRRRAKYPTPARSRWVTRCGPKSGVGKVAQCPPC